MSTNSGKPVRQYRPALHRAAATTAAAIALSAALASTAAADPPVPPAAPAGPAAAAPAPRLDEFLVPAHAATYSDDLDGWIHNALDILGDRGIPASYEAIHRNVMRESSGNPRAINLNDSNAAAGIPSKGLLQVIDPTFQAFHVDGTSWDIFDPVANIAAACNYAASRYGSIDNVDSAY